MVGINSFFLQKNDIKMEEEIRKSKFQPPVSNYYDSHSEDDEYKIDDDDDDEDNALPGYDDTEDETDIIESVLEEKKDAITPLQSSFGTRSIGLAGKSKSSLRFGKQKSGVSFEKQKSMEFSVIQEERINSEANEENEKSMTQSMVFNKSKSTFGLFTKSKSTFRLFSQKSKKLANLHKSLADMANEVAKRKKKRSSGVKLFGVLLRSSNRQKLPMRSLLWVY